MILEGSNCQCKGDSTLDEATDLCLCNYNAINFVEEKKRLKFTTRDLQATTTTLISAQEITENMTYDGVEFKSLDETFATLSMFTVPSFIPYLQVTFRNCIVDVRGKFF
jgi:hypothetical protein